jgi:deoxyribonuclease-1-like protein
MSQLARIVANFDLVAIQEVQSPQAMPVPRLVDLINRSGGRYDATVSEPIGHTTYREQYAFVWDTTRIRMLPESAYVVRDNPYPDNRMHRPPMVASFETRTAAVMGRPPFRFTIINVHTDPSQVSPKGDSNEMDVLDDVFLRVRDYEFQVRQVMNVLLVGDLNVSTANLGQLGQIPGILSVVGNTPTNTAGNKTYDHILLDQTITTEYTGVFGVIDYERDYGLSSEEAKRVSDHRPVWAEFSAYEMPPLSTAARPAATR